MVNLTIPHKFAGLEPAVANEVNENFEAMKAYTIALQTELNTINEALAELDKKPVREVFAVYPSVSSKTPTGAYPLWTGETITNARTLFPAFWQECLSRKTQGTIKTVVSNTEYDAVVDEFGQCSSFYIDELNGHIRLPMVTKFVSSVATSSDLGRLDKAGLPEIEGVLYPITLKGKEPSGAFRKEGSGGTSHTGSSKTYAESANTFKASYYNEIYGGSETVQPESVSLCWFIQVATNVADIADMDLETIARELTEASEQLQSEYDLIVDELNSLYAQLSAGLSGSYDAFSVSLNDDYLEKAQLFNENYDEKSSLINAEVVRAENAADEAQRIADDLGAIISFKGRVDSVSELPSSGNKTGDAYFVGLVDSSQKEEYVWDGVKWELFGVSSGSLSDYYTKEQTDALLEESFEKTVFSINEASKDASGNPSFMSISGNQITFNGAVKYTQANGESREYASVGSIDVPSSGLIAIDNGVASAIPDILIQQSTPSLDVGLNTVWFNPYNSEAKQWNGASWVNYTGVIVGNYKGYTNRYNTWNDAQPWLRAPTEKDKDIIASWTSGNLVAWARSGKEWWNVYEQGGRYFCMQGGERLNKGTFQLNFNLPFKDSNYTLIANVIRTTGGDTWGATLKDFFPSYSTVYIASGYTGVKWFAYGEVNKPEGV